MTFEQILLKLTEPQKTREDAVVLGRLGFLDWLISLPLDDDFALQAEAAYARAAPLKVAVPAVGVLCELLLEAANVMPPTGSVPKQSRGKRARRRSYH